MPQLVFRPGCVIRDVVHDGDGLVVRAHRRRGQGRCPSCGDASTSVHSRYVRRPSDLPSVGWPVRLHLRVRRFRRRNWQCRRRTAEQTPKLVASHSRRTRLLAGALTRIGLSLGGEVGSRLGWDRRGRLSGPTHAGIPARGRTWMRATRTAPAGAGPMARTRRRFLAGEGLAAIGRATGLSRGTVRTYAHADEAPERRPYGPGASRLDPYTSHLDARLRAGCENASALWREIVALGYTGTPKQVLRYVAQHRSTPSPQTPRKWLGHRDGSQRTRSVAAELPSPRAMAWAMTRPGEELAVDEAVTLARVRQDAEARGVADLARRFTALIRAASPDRARSNDDPRPMTTPGTMRPRPSTDGSARRRPAPRRSPPSPSASSATSTLSGRPSPRPGARRGSRRSRGPSARRVVRLKARSTASRCSYARCVAAPASIGTVGDLVRGSVSFS